MSEYALNVTAEHLGRLPRDEQLEVMEAWFRERYEDPVNRTPYDSEEGGYVWIWGGPYDAEEVLREEFEGVVPDSVIEALAEDLGGECWQWAPVASDDDYDHDLAEVVSAGDPALPPLREALQIVRDLLKLRTEPRLEGALNRLLFAGVITALETYLSETFINAIMSDNEALRRYVETTPEFSKTSVAYSEIFTAAEEARDKAKQHLLSLVWHNLAKVQPMYRDTLRIDIKDGLADVARAIAKRHDLVHRNGRDREGNPVVISADDVLAVTQAVEHLAVKIEQQLPGRPDF